MRLTHAIRDFISRKFPLSNYNPALDHSDKMTRIIAQIDEMEKNEAKARRYQPRSESLKVLPVEPILVDPSFKCKLVDAIVDVQFGAGAANEMSQAINRQSFDRVSDGAEAQRRFRDVFTKAEGIVDTIISLLPALACPSVTDIFSPTHYNIRTTAPIQLLHYGKIALDGAQQDSPVIAVCRDVTGSISALPWEAFFNGDYQQLKI